MRRFCRRARSGRDRSRLDGRRPRAAAAAGQLYHLWRAALRRGALLSCGVLWSCAGCCALRLPDSRCGLLRTGLHAQRRAISSFLPAAGTPDLNVVCGCCGARSCKWWPRSGSSRSTRCPHCSSSAGKVNALDFAQNPCFSFVSLPANHARGSVLAAEALRQNSFFVVRCLDSQAFSDWR